MTRIAYKDVSIARLPGHKDVSISNQRVRGLVIILLLSSFAASGCEPPTAPDLSNPYDPQFEGTAIPSPPSELELAQSGPEEVTIHWRDNSSFEDAYIIERSDGVDTTFSEIARVDSNVTSFTDKSLDVTRSYRFRVRAVHRGVESLNSGPIRIRQAGLQIMPLPADVHYMVHELRFSPDGSQLVAGGHDGFILDVDPLRVVRELGDYGPDAFDLDYSADGRYVATGGIGRVEVWRSDGQLERRLHYPNDERAARGLSLTADGRVLAYAWGSAEIRLWDWERETLTRIVNPVYPSVIYDLAFVDDGAGLVAGADHELLHFDLESKSLTKRTPLERWQPSSIFGTKRMSPDGRFLAVADRGRITLWSTADGRIHAEAPQESAAALVLHGGLLFTNNYRDGQVYRTDDLQLMREYSFLELPGAVNAMSMSADLRYLAAVVSHSEDSETSGRHLYRWDLSEGWQIVPPSPVHSGTPVTSNVSARLSAPSTHPNPLPDSGRSS